MNILSEFSGRISRLFPELLWAGPSLFLVPFGPVA